MNPYGKNLLGLGAMALIAGALGLYAFYGVKETDERETRREEDESRLFRAHEAGERLADGGIPEVTFTRLTVEAKGEKTSLERQPDGGWELTSPVRAPADNAVVQGLVSSLQATKTKATVEENPTPEDLQKYGLSPPGLKVAAAVTLPDGGVSELTVEGGVENDFDRTMYLRRSSAPAVHQVEAGVRAALEKNSFDLREKSVLALDEASIEGLELRTPKHKIKLTRNAEGNWQVTNAKGKKVAADKDALVTFLRSVAGIRAKAFPADSPEQQQRLGLKKPAYVLEAFRKGGGSVRLSMAAPAGDAGTANVGARREDGEDVLLAELASSAASILDMEPSDFEDKTVLTFKQDDVARIRLRKGGEPAIDLEKASGAPGGIEQWTLVAPQTGKAKDGQVPSLLWTLSSLKAFDRVERAPGSLKSLGLEPPERQVELRTGDGKLLATLAIGGKVSGEEDRLWVKNGENALFQADAARINALPFAPGELLQAPEVTPGADGGTAASAPSH